MSYTSSSRKIKALQAKKQELLDNIKFCDKRIEEVRLANSQAYIDNEDSSDSDCGPPPPLTSLSAKHLDTLESQLSTCLQATQELTGLRVFEWEMNVLAEPPVLEDGPPAPRDGLWREVMAECRVDIVPFSLNFYVHKPPGPFSAQSFFGLRACATKPAHARELNATGTPLATAQCPSEAVQIMSSYAAAARSRRSTLASLAERYQGRLTMEELVPEGGYRLRCAGLLSVSWSLQNKWSPIAPFQHRLKFDLEFMDESQIKQIRHLYRQLLDPALLAGERTALLAEIVGLCLAAGGEASATESEGERERSRTTLDQEPETAQFERQPREKLPEMAQNELKDSEVMAPPKQLPRKVKPKGKENFVQEAKTAKRALPTEEGKTKDISEKDNATVPKQKKLDNGKEKAKTVNNDVRDADGKEKTVVKRPMTIEVGDEKGDRSSKKIKQSVIRKENKEPVVNDKTVENVKTVATNKVDTNKDENETPVTQIEEFINGNVAHGINSDNIQDIVDDTKETKTSKTADKNVPQKPKIVTKPKEGGSQNSELKKTGAQVQKAAKIPVKAGQVKSLVGDAAKSKQPIVVKNTVANKDIANKDKFINKEKPVSKDIADNVEVISKDKPASKDVANKDKVINKEKPVGKDIADKGKVISKDKPVSKDIANKGKVINKEKPVSKDIANKDKVINNEKPVGKDIADKDKVISKDRRVSKDIANKDKVINKEKPVSKDIANKDKVINKEKPVGKDIADKDKVLSKDKPVSNDIANKDKVINKEKPVSRDIADKDRVKSKVSTNNANEYDVGDGEVISRDVANKDKIINKGKAISKDVEKDKVINKDVANKEKVINKGKAISKEISKKIDKAVINNKVINRVVTGKDKVQQNLAAGSKVGDNIARKVIQNPVQKVSRIPQKKLTTVAGVPKFRNPLRISPRKSPSAPTNFQRSVPPPTTNIK